MKKMIEEVYSTIRYEPKRYGKSDDHMEYVYRQLFLCLSNLLNDEKESLPVDISETESAWTSGSTMKLSAYLVNEKLFNILKYKITPDMLLRLATIDITEIMKFIAKYEKR